jgi:hypothetical protein
MAKAPKPTSWYTFTSKLDGGFTAHKYLEDGEHAEDYELNKNGSSCSCPAHVPFCRHKAMLVVMKDKQRIDTGWQYNHDTKEWKEPIKLDL